MIRDAFDALLYALMQKKTVVTLDELRLYQCVFPLVRDKTTRAMMAAMIARLEDYDRESSSGCLVATLDAYSKTGYSIPATAALLQQHPNTIRYRLKKITELTCGKPEEEHGLFLLGGIPEDGCAEFCDFLRQQLLCRRIMRYSLVFQVFIFEIYCKAELLVRSSSAFFVLPCQRSTEYRFWSKRR